MVARWSANPLGMLWPEMDAAVMASGGNGGGNPPAVATRPVVVIAARYDDVPHVAGPALGS
jgi:hypothetical protein